MKHIKKMSILSIISTAVFLHLPAKANNTNTQTINPTTFVAQTKIAAEQGNPIAEYNLGRMYYFGNYNTSIEYKPAIYWFKKSAEQGYAPSELLLGMMYESGLGTTKDYEKSIYWYTKSANQGNSYAEYFLASIYSRGDDNVNPDLNKAKDLYEKSANHGNVDAALQLGTIYI